MKTFRQLREQLILSEMNIGNQKGWVNYKTKKLYQWKPAMSGGKPWHIQYVCNNPKKFGLTEKKILDILAKAGWIDPATGRGDIPDNETKENLELLKTGVFDQQNELRQHLEKNGWMEFVTESSRGITAGNNRASTKDLHSAAKILEKALSISSTVEFDKSHEVVLNGAVGSTRVRVTDRFTWKTFLNTGKVVKQKSALAAFR